MKVVKIKYLPAFQLAVAILLGIACFGLSAPAQNSNVTKVKKPSGIGSETRVWRYVVLGSAVVILVPIGVIAGFRLKHTINKRND